MGIEPQAFIEFLWSKVIVKSSPVQPLEVQGGKRKRRYEL